MKKDNRIITLRVWVFNSTRYNVPHPRFETLIMGFQAVSLCESTGKLIDVFDASMLDTDIFTRLCCWLNEQGGDSPIQAVIENTGDPMLDNADYPRSWKRIMAQLPNFPIRELIAHWGLRPYDCSMTPEEMARDMLTEIDLREVKPHPMPALSFTYKNKAKGFVLAPQEQESIKCHWVNGARHALVISTREIC